MTLAPLATPSEIIACAAWLFGTTPRDITAKSRFRRHVRPRWAVCYVLVSRGYSRARVAPLVGLRDHTTVIHALRRVEEIMATDPVFAGRVATLTALRDGEFLAQQRSGACKQHIPMLRSPKQPKDIVIWE